MPKVLVVGHVCLDIIPSLGPRIEFEPGKLIEAGPAELATGGAVANVGLALHRLGVDVGLLGKISDDLFGRALLSILDGLTDRMVVAAGAPSSYTVVLNSVGTDRMFIHAPGCNATFSTADVSDDALRSADWMHFGYPPLLARMFEDGGSELVDVFHRAKSAGLTTSLDMSLPDPDSPAGKANWRNILQRVLPLCDFFLPSADEMRFVFPETLDAPAQAEICAELGAKVVGIKMGERGLYCRPAARPCELGNGIPRSDFWVGEPFVAEPFQVEVAGTTGAGDATIAGLIAYAIAGHRPKETLTFASAVGAFSCERADAVSGIPSREAVERRISNGWKRGTPK
jgi:sugar/nucleoside kinase (ribokinase family)